MCGHIHESHGILQEGDTTTVNAAVLDQEGKLAWQPVVLGGTTYNKLTDHPALSSDIATDGSVNPVFKEH